MCELSAAAEREFGRAVPTRIVGPSNVGNLLATRGIAATAGFGVSYRGVHAIDECVELATIEPVYRSYRSALQTLFNLG